MPDPWPYPTGATIPDLIYHYPDENPATICAAGVRSMDLKALNADPRALSDEDRSDMEWLAAMDRELDLL